MKLMIYLAIFLFTINFVDSQITISLLRQLINLLENIQQTYINYLSRNGFSDWIYRKHPGKIHGFLNQSIK